MSFKRKLNYTFYDFYPFSFKLLVHPNGNYFDTLIHLNLRNMLIINGIKK